MGTDNKKTEVKWWEGREKAHCTWSTFELVDYDFFLSFFKIFIVIQLQLSSFSPHPSTPPQPNPPPSPASTLPLNFVHVSFIVAPIDPSPHYPLLTPLWLLLGYDFFLKESSQS